MLYFLETDGLVDLFPAAGVPGPSGSRTPDLVVNNPVFQPRQFVAEGSQPLEENTQKGKAPD